MTVEQSYKDTINTIERLIAISKRENRDCSQLLKDKEKAEKMYREFIGESK